jgi:uncharacterized protein YjiS (DUF1127 family)
MTISLTGAARKAASKSPREIGELAEMSDHLLRDIGIDRDGIGLLAWRLRARAGT